MSAFGNHISYNGTSRGDPRKIEFCPHRANRITCYSDSRHSGFSEWVSCAGLFLARYKEPDTLGLTEPGGRISASLLPFSSLTQPRVCPLCYQLYRGTIIRCSDLEDQTSVWFVPIQTRDFGNGPRRLSCAPERSEPRDVCLSTTAREEPPRLETCSACDIPASRRLSVCPAAFRCLSSKPIFKGRKTCESSRRYAPVSYTHLTLPTKRIV